MEIEHTNEKSQFPCDNWESQMDSRRETKNHMKSEHEGV